MMTASKTFVISFGCISNGTPPTSENKGDMGGRLVFPMTTNAARMDLNV